MPALSYRELAGEAHPPIVEQLIAPNALRQRRFRERQKALRNACSHVALYEAGRPIDQGLLDMSGSAPNAVQ